MKGLKMKNEHYLSDKIKEMLSEEELELFINNENYRNGFLEGFFAAIRYPALNASDEGE